MSRLMSMDLSFNRRDYTLLITAAIPELRIFYDCVYNFTETGFSLSEFIKMGQKPSIGYIIQVNFFTCFFLVI